MRVVCNLHTSDHDSSKRRGSLGAGGGARRLKGDSAEEDSEGGGAAEQMITDIRHLRSDLFIVLVSVEEQKQ